MAAPNRRLVISAGEASGDQLGAELARSLKALDPSLELAGIAGPAMREAGVEAWFDLESLNVMGLTEVLRHLPRLLRLRRAFHDRILAWQADAFIGVDAPDFNLGLARRLRKDGLTTVHYVAPTVWAWRPGRAAGIARSLDLLLALFPFEPELFRDHHLDTRFVGHPLADRIADRAAPADARAGLDLPADVAVIALLPGSRRGEIERHARLMADTAAWLRSQRPDCRLVMLLAHKRHESLVRDLAGELLDRAAVEVIPERTREGLISADVAITASGTATLEGFLLECPLVVYYRLAPATYWLLRGFRLVRSQHIALPNILNGQAVVPEFIQRSARADNLGRAAIAWLEGADRRSDYQQAARRCRAQLAAGASDNAARAILEVTDHAGA